MVLVIFIDSSSLCFVINSTGCDGIHDLLNITIKMRETKKYLYNKQSPVDGRRVSSQNVPLYEMCLRQWRVYDITQVYKRPNYILCKI
jgi:hypothetical protein